MTTKKEDLLKQMDAQRFAPITAKTYQLYETYSSLIDIHNPNDLAYLLFYKGEYFFRVGNFNDALSSLSRCLQAPKDAEHKQLDALSYSIMGLIYSYLGQENIALHHFRQSQELCMEYHFEQYLCVCYANIALLYFQLQDYKTSLHYFQTAITQMADNDTLRYNLSALCEAYRGTIYCKICDRTNALKCYDTINRLKEQNNHFFYDAAVLNLNIQLYDFLEDKDFLHQNLERLLSLVSAREDFLESSESYFDACFYLISKQFQEESFSLLEYIRGHVEQSPLAFLKHQYLTYKMAYTRLFCNRDDYLHACSELIQIKSDYHEEQRFAKLYNLDYTERLRLTRNNSEMYRQKSQLDQMTGLLNKYTIQFFIEEDLSSFQPDTCSAMILIDMDHFKQINDTLGHLAGDNLICQTASIIQGYFKENALCGRIGGDEFLIYLTNVTDPSFVILQSEILRQEIFRQTSERNITITTQASIGIAFSSEDYYNYETMFSAADEALYKAKMQGRNKIIVADR